MRRIETKETRDESHVWLEIYLVGAPDERVVKIASVTKEKAIWGPEQGQWMAATVNWAGWGARDAATALEFASALTYAAHAAARLDGEGK